MKKNVSTPKMEYLNVRDVAVINKKIILSLDLGLNLGYVVGYFDEDKFVVIAIGTLNLNPKRRKKDSNNRCHVYRAFINFLNEVRPDKIYYEDIRYTPPKGCGGFGRLFVSLNILIALKAFLEDWACSNGCEVFAVNPSKITAFLRRFQPEIAKEKKEAAIRSANIILGHPVVDSHSADALLTIVVNEEYWN